MAFWQSKAKRDANKARRDASGMGYLGRQYSKWVGGVEGVVGGETGKAFGEGLTSIGEERGILPGKDEGFDGPPQMDTLDLLLAAMKKQRFASSGGYSKFFQGRRDAKTGHARFLANRAKGQAATRRPYTPTKRPPMPQGAY